jgi:hypothetical protein
LTRAGDGPIRCRQARLAKVSSESFLAFQATVARELHLAFANTEDCSDPLMPIDGPWIRLTPYTLEAVPQLPGVYELGNLVRNTVYIGRSADRDLRSCLGDEIADPRCEAIRRQARYFRYEPTPHDDVRQRELLEEYGSAHRGEPPPGNVERDDGARNAPATGPTRRGLRLVSSARS